MKSKPLHSYIFFSTDDAIKHGVNKAILLQHLRSHQSNNVDNPNFIYDDKVWAFTKLGALEKIYPFMSTSSITRWLRELEEDGVILSAKHKVTGWNHTKFYHVVED